MWVRPVSRREVIDLISLRRSGEGIDAVEASGQFLDSVPPDEMVAIWPAHPREFGALPATIVVPANGHREFLAWVATYVRDFRPFTSFCRIVERPIAERLLLGPPAPMLRQAEGICAGLVVGEALAQSRGRTDLRDFPASTYPATLSYVLSRALAITGSTSLSETVISQWAHAREFTSQSRTTVSPSAVAAVWSIPFGFDLERQNARTLFEATDNVREAWQELISRSEINEKAWERLTNGVPEFRSMRDMLRLPRERRLELVDAGLGLLAAARRDDDERWPFLAGYITSMLSPGTLDHAEVLAHAAGALPTAFLWYGLFAGLGVRGEGLSIGNPVARRIIRDLTAPDRLMDRPRCDISFEELAMIGPGEGAQALKGTRSGRLDVDLLPGVTMAVRWSPQEGLADEEVRRARDEETQRLLMEIEETAKRQRMLADRLRDTLGMNDRHRPVATTKRKRPDKT
jgi:hypothetical protein